MSCYASASLVSGLRFRGLIENPLGFDVTDRSALSFVACSITLYLDIFDENRRDDRSKGSDPSTNSYAAFMRNQSLGQNFLSIPPDLHQRASPFARSSCLPKNNCTIDRSIEVIENLHRLLSLHTASSFEIHNIVEALAIIAWIQHITEHNMVASKFLKLAAGGVAIAAIAIGVGVGTGIYSKNKKIEAAAATSIGCRRLLHVPGIDIEDNAADAPSTGSKLLARSLGGLHELVEPRAIESYESAEWYGDAYKPAPSGHAPSSPSTKSKSKSSSKGLKGTHGPYGFTSTKGTSGKGPKGSSTSGINSYGPKGPKGTSGLGSSGPKGSKSSKGLPVRSYCSFCLLLFFGRF